MAGYDGGYGSHSGTYGYGYGGYYSSPPPGGYLDASADLTGPGSHAFAQQSYGRGYVDSSYACESYRGGIFQQNTTEGPNTVSQETTYSYTAAGGDGQYGSSGYRYSSFSTSFETSHPTSSFAFGYYGYGGDSIPNHLETSNHASSVRTDTPAGGFDEVTQRSFSLTSYTDGSSVGHYSTTTETLYAGHLVAGTSDAYSVSAFDYGNGYTAYIAR